LNIQTKSLWSSKQICVFMEDRSNYKNKNISEIYPPRGTYRIKLSREDFGFSSGHIFISSDNIETSHGHSYQIATELEGQLTEDFILTDFRTIKEFLRPICKHLNNRLLIPALNKKLEIVQNEQYTKITFKDKHIEFPTSEALCLDLPNLSCEMLAYFIFRELQNRLKSIETNGIKKMTIWITESAGQAASFEGEI